MVAKLLRFAVVAAALALGAWWGRLIAHSKSPPPEGTWREIPPGDLE